VDLEWTIRRRRIGQPDLLLIRELISAEGHRERSYISNRLCEIWDWRQDNGRFRQIACRHLLRQLEGNGLVKLPPMLKPARRAGYVNRVPAIALLDQSRLTKQKGVRMDSEHENHVMFKKGDIIIKSEAM
jgi:hypothetical protein